MAPRPTKVRVGPYDIKVTDEHDPVEAARYYGSFEANRLLISLRKGQQPVVEADTLLHEIIHAIWFVYDIQARKGEERVVRPLATALIQVLRDNPGLRRWLEHTLGT